MRCRLLWIAALLTACGTTANRPVRVEPAEAAPADEPRPDQATAERASDSDAQASAPDAVELPAPSPRSIVLANVAEESLTAEDLLGRWLHRDPTTVRRYIEELILERLVELEARRLGITLPDDLLASKLAESEEQMQREIARGGTSLTIDEFVQRRLALDPQRYREAMRDELRLDLLAERAVRAWLLTSERARVQTIVVDEQPVVDQILAGLARDESFESLAREHSLEPNLEDGLQVHTVVRSPSPMARLAFSTAVGEVGGPVPQSGRFLLVKVLSRDRALEGSWSVLREPVEASLAERPIEDPEYWQWKDAMLELYPVDMQPFLQVLPEASGD